MKKKIQQIIIYEQFSTIQNLIDYNFWKFDSFNVPPHPPSDEPKVYKVSIYEITHEIEDVHEDTAFYLKPGLKQEEAVNI